MWNPKTGVDLIRLKSCRLEKRRSGPIAFGGLNVLRIDDLVLNLPFPREEKAAACEGGAREFVQVGDLSDTLFGNGRLPYGKASGIRIEGLTVNRVEGREVVPVFSADVLRNRGRQLVLEHCRVYEDGRTNVVGKAELKRTPSPVLVWHGGTRCLDDLVVKVKESK